MNSSLRRKLLAGACCAAIALSGGARAMELVTDTSDHDVTGILRERNKDTYQYLADDQTQGTIDLYSNETGVYVPVSDLLAKLGYVYYNDDMDRVLQVYFPDGTTLTIRFNRGEYIYKGETRSLYSNDFLIRGSEIFLNYNLLNKTFPVGFSFDQAALKFRVVKGRDKASLYDVVERLYETYPLPNTEMFLPSEKDAALEDYPVPLPAPLMPVIVDDFMSRMTERNKSERGTTKEDVLLFSEPRPEPPMICEAENADCAAPETAAAEKLSEEAQPLQAPQLKTSDIEEKESGEDDLLVLQPKIKKSPPSDLFVEAMESGEKLYLPFAQMMQLLEFDVKVDEKKGTAEGTFISPERKFSLDKKAGKVSSDGNSFYLSKDSVKERDGVLYVLSEDFEKWFGIKCGINKQMMYLVMDTDVVLPMEARLVRHNLWRKLLNSQNVKNIEYPSKENEYKLVDWPFVDVNLSSAYTNDKGSRDIANEYTVMASGDLGYLTTDVYAAGDDQKQFDNIRVKAGRKDSGGSLLGFMKATSYSFGDIESPALTLVSSSDLGRGASISNRALNLPDNFDTHTFSGDAVPGWEVELYRNNLLLDFQTVNDSGRYEFKDVPLLFGNNVFRVVLYGPQGQSEDRVETITVGNRMLSPGKFEYAFSANEQGKSVIEMEDDSSTASGEDEHFVRAVAEARYGFTDYLTAGAGMAQTNVDGEEHRYVTASADVSAGGILSEANVAKDLNGGWVAGVTSLTSIYDVSVRARHRQYFDFVSPVESNSGDNKRSSVSDVDFNGQFYVPYINDFNFGMRARYETFVGKTPVATFTTTYSKAFWGLSYSNSVEYVFDKKQKVQGHFGLQTRVYNVTLRGDGMYTVKPVRNLRGTTLTAQYRLMDKLGAQTKIDQQLDGEKNTTLMQSINWDLDKYRLSLSGQASDDMQYAVGLSLIFSVGHEGMFNRWHMRSQPISSAGAVSARVFNDDNYNGQFDENESVVADSKVRINRIPVRSSVEPEFIAPISSYTPVKVDVDPNSFIDPLMASAVSGYTVMTRPGDVVGLDFPVIATSEIDGNVVLLDGEGERHEIPDIVVELLGPDGAVIKRVMSESDGYYVFPKIKPGEYIVSVPDEALAEYNAELPEKVRLKIDKISDFYTGNDLKLRLIGELPKKIKRRNK